MSDDDAERRYYLAVAEKGEGESWGVYFPDFPGCISAGETFAEAAAGAHEALALHIEGMTEDGLELPAPTPPELVQREVGAQCLMVEATAPSRSVRLNISLDEGLVRRVDRAAELQGLTRSGFLAAAARDRLSTGSDGKRLSALLAALISKQLPQIQAELEGREPVRPEAGKEPMSK